LYSSDPAVDRFQKKTTSRKSKKTPLNEITQEDLGKHVAGFT
jgi:hypothetical protein